MFIEKLQEQEQFLTERVTRLKSSLKEVELNLEPETIEQKAEKLRSLETQLYLTEKALQNTQSKLTARKQLEGSKEYKDKQKLSQELLEQAQKETVKVFKTLQEVQKQTQGIHSKLKQYDKLQKEFTGEVQYFATAQGVQPFAWLGTVHKSVQGLLHSTTWLKDKLN
jgi:hypothetical protein